MKYFSLNPHINTRYVTFTIVFYSIFMESLSIQCFLSFSQLYGFYSSLWIPPLKYVLLFTHLILDGRKESIYAVSAINMRFAFVLSVTSEF